MIFLFIKVATAGNVTVEETALYSTGTTVTGVFISAVSSADLTTFLQDENVITVADPSKKKKQVLIRFIISLLFY
jgi:phage gp45-like